ncbi:DUF4202 domain-containing protein [Chromohalobacter canadensis]|uniref:DUF4202 domain-containing protein n=1 Tax=Chromohalobacter canadensis TaxID=141389 RepID=UPI0021C1A2F2|nr:DUF4202 domain-containing protein [Chromohalobacter canadensis]MCT8469895.1 DUF4202 domain-containing protein [Chromohalobacter canadensis]MCT8471817.1 DUF4202 domain-containing protein [Chromohalobacter canadensis]MCT8499270.1 DUF4202 domain-containing protein [Chromohalobacter canadensis]
MPESTSFQRAQAAMDAAHAEDPQRETTEEDGEQPAELLYAQRMSDWLVQVAPEASEPLQLAVRAQHLRRWEVPRDDYPRDRPGYLAWRRDLGRRQAALAEAIVREAGYDEDDTQHVGALIRKENLKRDADTQALEDTACLVFMAHYFRDFAREHDDDKLVRIVAKTWRKMSPRGHELASALTLSERESEIVARALSA